LAPLVSIVVPSFQQARFLRAALDSVLAQDWSPLEVLVLDGGSTDGTVEVLQSYGERIWWRSRADRGQCDAINEGMRRGRGEIVAWLNSDDFYYPGAVRKAVTALQAEPQAGLVYGEGNLVDEQGNLLWRFPETVPFDLWRLAHVADYILQPTVFFRRAVLQQWCDLERGSVLDLGMHWALDWDLWLRLGAHVRFAYLPETLAASRVWRDTKTATGGWRRLREILAMLKRHGVRGASPAAIAHGITTAARRFRRHEAPMTAGALLASVPRGLRPLVRPLANGAERRLRRWQQNAQGVWRDGHVGRLGHLWLPNDGRATRVVLRGQNLDLAQQVIGVTLEPFGHAVRTAPLPPGGRFELGIDVPREVAPIKLVLVCTRTRRVTPLDPALGPRRAGCRIDAPALVV
jgi:hypothetical protein